MITTTLLILATSGVLGPSEAPVIQRPGSAEGAPLVQRPGEAAAAPALLEEPPAQERAEAIPVVAETPEPVATVEPESSEPPQDEEADAPQEAPEPEEEPTVAVAELAMPVLQRPRRQKAAWTPFDDDDVDVMPPAWTPFDDADGPRIVPPSLLARFKPEALKRPVIRSTQVWEEEEAPIVANPDLGRHSRKWRRGRRWR